MFCLNWSKKEGLIGLGLQARSDARYRIYDITSSGVRVLALGRSEQPSGSELNALEVCVGPEEARILSFVRQE
jgi:hypothetical protein